MKTTAKRAPKTILIIDDEPQLAKSLALILRSNGYGAIVANGGREGLELWHELQGEIDLTMVDINMPEVDGFTVMRDIKKTCPDCNIIAMSAETSLMTRDRCPGGIFLAKPFEVEDLLGAVNSLLK